jgi:hypothetical protein
MSMSDFIKLTSAAEGSEDVSIYVRRQSIVNVSADTRGGSQVCCDHISMGRWLYVGETPEQIMALIEAEKTLDPTYRTGLAEVEGLPTTLSEEMQRAIDWLFEADMSTSSRAIWQMMVHGKVKPGTGNPPWESSDFGTCYRLLLLLPEWKARIGEMSLVSGWAPYVAAWDELTNLYMTGGECFGRMMDIRNSGTK